MFSKRTAIILSIVLVIAANIVVISIAAKNPHYFSGLRGPAVFLISPFQKVMNGVTGFLKEVWINYFFLVSVSEENERLKRTLEEALENNRALVEIESSNTRLKSILNLQQTAEFKLITAQVIGKGHSPWFRSVIIDKGSESGIRKGLPVIIPSGIVGQIIETNPRSSKILLITDQNSAIDAVVQRTRARGIIEGEPGGGFNFKYVLRKDDVRAGDTVVSSGLDGVFPKGLTIGWVSGVVKPVSGVFQEVSVLPLVELDKLEEVSVILNPPKSKPGEGN
ncbi:MAG: rod shape-determining protein MreC [Thermodesulfobacteriota bacterium]